MATFAVTDSRGYTHTLNVVEDSYDIASNTSQVSYSYTLTSGAYNGFSQYGIEWGIWINGTCVMYHNWVSAEYTCRKGGNVIVFGSGTVTIQHGADGKKSIDCYAKIVRLDGASYTPIVGTQPSGTLKLTDIPRGAAFIDNGSSFGRYQCYIDNGYSFDLYIPYIDNGSSWDLLS